MKDKVFISSVQKELEAERLALLALLTTDPFLKDHVEPVLFEQLPPPTRPAGKPYLDTLRNCTIYVLMLDRDYADKDVDVSPTREEYDLARSMGIPAMALVKGKYDDRRDAKTQAFFNQIKADKFTYKRFTDRRNPVIAECLAALDMMEQRGTGFERIRAAMLDHGLEAHQLDQRDGYFKVILPGPNGNFDRLRVSADARGFVPPSVEAALNERQKRIMVHVQTEGSVTSGWCRKTFGVAYQSVYRDLTGLVKTGLLAPTGSGRSARYVIGGGRA